MDKAVEELQQELKVLKNEIKETLTDVREVLLNTVENPFPQDLTSKPMSAPPSQAPQAAARPAQQDPPTQPQPTPQQSGFPGQGAGMPGGVIGGMGGQPIMFGNMGGGVMPSLPPVMPQQASIPPGAPAQVPHASVPPAPASAPAGEQQSLAAPAQVDGPGLPPPGTRRERSGSAQAPSDGPGLPPRRDRDAGPRRTERTGDNESERDRSSSRDRRRPSTRLGAQRRPFSSNMRSEEEPIVDDGDYEEPYEDEELDELDERRPAASAGRVDLVVLASLSPWLSEGIRRVGRKRVKAILDIYASMGGMSLEMKDVLVQIADMDDTEGSHDHVTVQDSMRMLIELDDLMWRGRQDWRRAALMTMLSGDEGLRS